MFNHYGTVPEARWVTSGDAAYARLQRSTIAANNLFEGKNQVQQVGGIGKALRFHGVNQSMTGDDTGMPSGTVITFTYVTAFRVGTGTNPFFTPLSWGSDSANMKIIFGDETVYVYTAGTGLFSYNFGPGYYDNNWHQLVVTISGQTGTIYIDNTLLYTTDFVNTYNILLAGANNFLTYRRTDEPAADFDMDQTLIYNRVLSRNSGPGSTDEITPLWKGGDFTAEPPTNGLIRRYEYEEGTWNLTYDTNPNGVQYTLTLLNDPSWLPVGIVPVSAVASEAVFFSVADGLTNAERGIATWGDFNGRNQQQGKWFQWFQGSNYPLVSNNTGQWLFNPANTADTCPAILSTVEVAGNLALGTGYTGINIAPVNGLLVQGNTLLGTSTDNGIDQLQIAGNLNFTTAGNKLKIATGANASIGTAILATGTATVSTTAVSSGSIIMLTNASPSGTIGILSVGAKTDGTSFVINSSSTGDTSTINWWIIN